MRAGASAGTPACADCAFRRRGVYTLELADGLSCPNRKTEQLARELARTAKLGLTEAVHIAVSNELQRRRSEASLWRRTAALRKRVRARIKNPQPVDKAFRDSLHDTRASRVR